MSTRLTTSTPTLTDVLFERSVDGLCLVAPDGTVVRANAEWLRSTGFSEEQVVGHDIIDLFPDARDMALAMHARARAGHRVEVPRHALTLNGRETWWQGSIEPVSMEGGSGLLITAREVTDVARDGAPGAEVRSGSAKSADAESRHAAELLDLGDPFCELDREFRVIRVNAAHERINRHRREQILGRTHWDVWPSSADPSSPYWREYHRCMSERVPVRFDAYYAALDVWTEVSAYPTSEGGIAIFWRDATKRKCAEEALRRAHETLATTLASITDGLAVLDRDWRYTYFSETGAKLLGVRREDLLGGCLWELFPHADELRFGREYRRAVDTGVPAHFEEFYPEPLNKWIECHCYPSADGLSVYFRDVTDRKRAEEALRDTAEQLARSEAVLAQASAMASLGAWWIDVADPHHLDSNPLRWSDEVYRIFGYEPGGVAVTNELFFEHVHPDDRRRVTDAVARALETRQRYVIQHRVVRRDGSERIVLEHGRAQYDAAGRLVRIVGAVQDVTAQKHAEEALRDSEARLRLALDAAKLGTFDLDIATGRLVWDEQKMRMWGISNRDDFRYPAVLDGIHPEDRALVAAAVEAALRTGEYESEYRVTWPDGSVHWLYARARVEFDEGRPARMIGIELDITDRKRAEAALRDANERLREADRRKDEFLATLSHELRNPLAPIRNSTYILRHAETGSDRARRAQIVIERQTEHLTRLVDDLLDVTRIARGKIELRRERVDLRLIVSRVAEDFQQTMEDRGVHFSVELPETRVAADGDATRIAQLVANLLHNAAKFTRRGDTVMIALTVDDGAAEIRIRDTGAGIDPEVLPRVFEAFVQGERTLARTEGGLGLGLALVKGIAELHGGSVRAHSAGKGRGAEFTVRLPLLVVREPDASPRSPTECQNGGRNVLVVDDNIDSAESLAELLRMLGHSVDVAYDGPTAIDKARANPPNVVLCDLGLPGMSGYEVARALRQTSAGPLQVFAVSGYAQPEDVKRAIEAGFDGHVTKPCDPEEIARMLV